MFEQVSAELLAQLGIVDEERVRQALLGRQQAVEQRLQLRRRDVVRQVQLRACASTAVCFAFSLRSSRAHIECANGAGAAAAVAS